MKNMDYANGFYQGSIEVLKDILQYIIDIEKQGNLNLHKEVKDYAIEYLDKVTMGEIEK